MRVRNGTVNSAFNAHKALSKSFLSNRARSNLEPDEERRGRHRIDTCSFSTGYRSFNDTELT